MDRLSTKGSMIDQIDLGNVPRSGFDRSFHNYLSGKLGKIIPTRVEEVLPGDRIKGSTHIVANFEPLVAPILGTMVMKQESFYIPQSVLWKSAHQFFTGKKGFNDPLPSVSLYDIYRALNREFIQQSTTYRIFAIESFLVSLFDMFIYDQLAWYEFDENKPDYAVIWSGFISNVVEPFVGNSTANLVRFGNQYFVYDLLYPLIKMFRSFKYDNDDYAWVGDPNFTIEEQRQYIERFIVDIMNFWFGPSSLLDYMGIGVYNINDMVQRMFYDPLHYGNTFDYLMSNIPFNWLPFRANYCVWYWNYRDQLLEANAFDAEDFMDNDYVTHLEVVLLILLRVRCWFKDTFTTALTNTGNGNILIPSVSSLYEEQARELTIGTIKQKTDNTTDGITARMAGGDIVTLEFGGIQYNVPSNYLVKIDSLQISDEEVGDYYVSLDMIDRARRLSTWLSKRLILGVEYDDVVYSSFMVKLSHVRMHVPELLDASRSTVSMNTIVNNTTIPDAQVAGDKTAVAWAENKSDGINYFAEEHGYLISYMTVLPIQSYAGGVQRMYLRQNRFDFAWPEFSQMGMDAIYNAELATPAGAGENVDDAAITVFGYQGRYYDYKSKLDEEHGRMRSDLNYMTFSRDFSLVQGAENQPKLNYIFVHCWPSLDMFVTDDPNVDIIRSIDCAHNYHWERVLPVPSETIR